MVGVIKNRVESLAEISKTEYLRVGGGGVTTIFYKTDIEDLFVVEKEYAFNGSVIEYLFGGITHKSIEETIKAINDEFEKQKKAEARAREASEAYARLRQ
jgi:hypothetical protein